MTVLPLVLACGSDSLKPEVIPNDRQLYWDLELDHHAVTLSTVTPYDTLAVAATPRNYLGEPIPGLPAAQYTSKDVERVAVSREGILLAVAPTVQPVWVIATLTTGNLKHQDSVLVRVVHDTARRVLANFSVHPLPPDSAKVAAGESFTGVYPVLPVRASNPDAISISGLPVHFRSSNPRIATIDQASGQIKGQQPGAVNFYATTTAFGVTKADTVLYRIGWPLLFNVLIDGPAVGFPPGSFRKHEITVGTGAFVTFSFPTGAIIITDVTFSEIDLPNVAAPIDASILAICFFAGQECGAGNIMLGPSPANRQAAVRWFPVPGTYEFRSTMHGTSGRLIVLNEQ